MLTALARSRRISILAAIGGVYLATGAQAEHTSDNPVTAAGDAYGLTLGLESIGLYNAGLVRGFSPLSAGNVRIDGLYFDEEGGLSNRVVEGSTIRVGVSEIGYAFPAPTGIVDYDLRHAGDGTPSATAIASVGPYEASGISVDGSVPLIGDELILPIGVSYQVSTATFVAHFPGYTSSIIGVGATPQWSPNDKMTVRLLFDYQQTRDAKTFPEYFTAGDFAPPDNPHGYFGQNWAKARSLTLNFGGLVAAQLSDAWSLRAGIFRSVNDSPTSFADLYTNIEKNAQAEHIVVAYPDQNITSTSGEVRITGGFVTGDWRHELIFSARGRDTPALYGGEDVVDLGPATIKTLVQVPEPHFAYSPRTIDRTQLWSVGAAYHADWRKRGEFEIGVQEENYQESAAIPGSPKSKASAHPIRAYTNAAFAVTDQFTVYGGYTQGLENSGTAPSSARNTGAVLPASLTWQADFGVRYAVTPDFKIIAGAFELQKPYFNLDQSNVDRELGAQRAQGFEFSIAGQPIRHLDINIRILAGDVGITGPNLAAQGVGRLAVGQPKLTYAISANYVLPWWPAASIDLSALHFGRAPENVSNTISTPALTGVNFGARYRFSVFGADSSLRLQVQRATSMQVWGELYTPGFLPRGGPRTVFAYLTTDLQP